MADELKPCPFCGGATSFEEFPTAPGWGRLTVNHAAGCFSKTPVEVMLLNDENVAAWNRRAALSSPAPAVPSGWKLVPAESTDQMEIAAENGYEERHEIFPDWKAAYRDMLAATPAQQS